MAGTQHALPDAGASPAERRLAAIRPLLDLAPRTRQAVAQRALEVGVDTATLYRWLRRFEAAGTAHSLASRPPGVPRGTHRTRPDVEQIISVSIAAAYLTNEHPSIPRILANVLRRCAQAGVNPPHPNTVRNRVARLDGSTTARFARPDEAIIADRLDGLTRQVAALRHVTHAVLNALQALLDTQHTSKRSRPRRPPHSS